MGDVRILRLGSVACAAGFLAVALIPDAAAALGAFVLIGLGASNIVPILFSAAGRVHGVPPGLSLATVTTIAYAGLLTGPALIGFVADSTSLPTAFIVVAFMLAGITLGARRTADGASAPPLPPARASRGDP